MKMTEHEAKAKALLPCGCWHIGHLITCPAYYVPAVAAALAERDAEIGKLLNRLQVRIDTVEGVPTGIGEDEIDRLHAELAQLRAELVWASNDEQLIKQLHSNCAAKDAELAQLRAKLACDACDGSGNAVSGPCGCRGLGLPEMLSSVRRALAEAETDRINIEKVAGERWTKLKAERDAAYKQGLRDALELCYDLPTGFKCRMAIAAEIDKAGK